MPERMGKVVRFYTPKYLRQIFKKEDIHVVFKFLEQRFGLSPQWQKQFHKECGFQHLSDTDYFFVWMKDNLDFTLKKIRFRHGDDSVLIDEIVIYLLRSKLEDRLMRDKKLQIFFENGGWQTPERIKKGWK
jgi:hypothetical protein